MGKTAGSRVSTGKQTKGIDTPSQIFNALEDIYVAVREDNVFDLARLLAGELSAAIPTDAIQQAFGFACATGSTEAARLLLLQGLDINRWDADGRSPLLSAIRREDEDMVKFLLHQGASTVSIVPLTAAAKNGHVSIVRLLLDHGAYPKCSDSFCLAPITEAVYARSEAMLRLLLDYCVTLQVAESESDGEAHLQAQLDASNTALVQRFSREQGRTIHFGQVVIHQAVLDPKIYAIIEFLSEGLALPNRYILSIPCEQLLSMTASFRITVSKC